MFGSMERRTESLAFRCTPGEKLWLETYVAQTPGLTISDVVREVLQEFYRQHRCEGEER
jgi:hypothetical protein